MIKAALILLLTLTSIHSQTGNLAQNTAGINFNTLSNLVPNTGSSTPSFPNGCNELECGWNTITVNGASTLSVVPDLATINLNVEASAANANDAINALSQRTTQVLKVLTNAGLNANNWKTTYLNVYPNTSYVNGQVITYGQIASQTMQISIPIVAANGNSVGKIYDGLAQTSGISINGLTFDLQDKTSSFIQARKLAFSDAVKRAQDYTNAAGVALKSVVTVTDSSSVAPVSPTPMAAMAMMKSASPVPTTVSVGTININYNVNVVFGFA